ncbi:MAG: glycosyl transferase family protein [Parcubacteria group bacterium Gr01-1014_31]|nr:MAG: glycosyl transferase family protein [Parcubacteria group bacterium Gr01-1014_31]
MWPWVRRHRVLTTIIAAALLLRMVGIAYGLPYVFVGDEPAMVLGALKMLQLKTLLPVLHPEAFRPLYYPPLLPYLVLAPLGTTLGVGYLFSGAADVATFVQGMVLDPTLIWVTARVVAAMLGTVTVYATYRLAREFFDRRAGLLSAALLSVSFLHVQLSHFIRHWVGATLAVTVVAIFAARIARGGSRRDYVLAGVAAGLGFGVSYIPLLALLLIGIAHWLNPQTRKRILHRDLLWSVGIAAGIAVLFVALHPQEFWRIAFGEDSGAGSSKSLFGLLASYGFHLRNYWQLEPALFILTLLGLPFVWRASRRAFALLTVMPFAYLTVLYLIFHDEVRYLLLILPLLSVVAGFGLSELYGRAKAFAQSSALSLLALVFAFPLAVSGKYLWLLTQPDTRQQAVAWVQDNIPAGTRVVTDVTTFRLTPTKDSITQQRELDAASLRQEDRTLLEVPDERYPQPSYEILPLHFLSVDLAADLSAPTLERAGFRFLIVEDAPTVRLETTALIAAGARVVQRFPAQISDVNGNFLQPVYTIFPARNLGPTVTVFEIPISSL